MKVVVDESCAAWLAFDACWHVPLWIDELMVVICWCRYTPVIDDLHELQACDYT